MSIKRLRRGVRGLIVERDERGPLVNFHNAPVKFLRYALYDRLRPTTDSYLIVEHLDGSRFYQKGDEREVRASNFEAKPAGWRPTLRPRLTIEKAKEQLRPLGVTLSKRDDEYRVNFLGGKEATASYTNDLEDALGAGHGARA